jgi:N-acetylglucosamine-6-sulfatase
MPHHVSRRSFLQYTAAGIAATAAAQAQGPGAASSTKRNVVFILIDDQRYDALGFAGHPFLETPHLDALARNGLVFDRAFVTTSLCSPSRASILTGQYAHRHGVLDNSTRLAEHVPTFPQELQRAGYETAFVGKWHMGGASDEPRPGFDRWVSFRGQGVYENPTLNIDGEKVEREGYTTDLLTDYAVDFLEHPHETPFMLYLSHKAVHAEFLPAPRHRDSYAEKHYPHPASMADTEEYYRGKPRWVRDQRASWHGVDAMYNHDVDFDEFAKRYAETMRAVDDSVGRVVQTLRDQGLLESTLLIYTSDNGFLFGEHGLIDKRTMYEESIRVPLIVHCPELIPAPGSRAQMILNLDFAPTILAAAGLPVPETVQGRSFLPIIEGHDTDWRDAFLYEYFWERSFPQTPTVLGVRTDTYKFMKFHGIYDTYELYDLEHDPDEMNNLLGAYMHKGEAGTLDNLIRRQAPEELRSMFDTMNSHLNRLLDETGARQEPLWACPE